MKLFSRTVWVLSGVSLLTDLASELLYPVMPLYLKSIGFSFAAIGLLEGIAELIAGMSKGYFGQWSDRLGRRLPFVRAGYALSALAKPLIVVSGAAAWIFGMRTMDRIGKGVRTAARDALLSSEARPGTKARVFSFHRSWDTVGAALGPLLAYFLLLAAPGDYRTIFYYAALPGLAAVALLFLLREKKQAPVSELKKGFFDYFGYTRQAPVEYRKLLLPLLLFAIGNSSDVFLLLRVKELTGSDTQMILAYIFYNAVYAGSAYPAGWLADRFGPRKILMAGMLLFALVYAGFGFATSGWHLFGLLMVYGVYAACTEGIAKAWITGLVPTTEAGRAVGLFASSQSIALFFSSVLAGLLWDTMGPALVFSFSAMMSVFAFVLMGRVRKM